MGKRNLPTQRETQIPAQPGQKQDDVDCRVYSEWQHGAHIESLPKEQPQNYSPEIKPLKRFKTMTNHQVKSWPEYFKPIIENKKTFDLRRDDRGYNVGDIVQFEEFKPSMNEHTGNVCQRRIVYILANFEGLLPGYCILGLEPV